MSAVFLDTLKPFLIISKMFGILNYCCLWNTDGLLYRDTTSTYFFFLEIIRTFVFLICSCNIFINLSEFYLIQFNVIKYWCIIIIAKSSERKIIEFVNGIIEFDRKLLSPAPSCSSSNRQQPAVRLDSPSMKLWTAMFAAYSALTVAFRVYYIHEFYTVAFVEKSHLLHLLFTSPEPIVFVVMITSCFYLRNLGDRFCALDRLCKQCLPPTADLTAAAAASVERVRLLHAELSELLRTFSAGYGPVLLVYFAFTFVHAVIETFLVVTFKRFRITTNVVPYIFYSQHMVNMLSILCITSWVINKKINIISNLRLVRLTEITDVKTKLQVKYFMNQISVNEPNELTAFGFFNLDLKLIMSILVLLITGIATIIQMKEHSVMIYLNNLLLPQFDRDSS